jgi:hypothetical protein
MLSASANSYGVEADGARSHAIVVDAYDDPGVKDVTCYVSRVKTGGIKGGLGLAEDKAEASIACRQTGPISFPQPIKREDVQRAHLAALQTPSRRAHGRLPAQYARLPHILRPSDRLRRPA